MGSPRDFTRQLLAQLDNKRGGQSAVTLHQSQTALQSGPGQPSGASVPAGKLLVAADSTCPTGAALVREALCLKRFGVQVTVFFDEALGRCMGRDLPADQRHIPNGPLNGAAFGSAQVLLAAGGPGLLAHAALGLHGSVAADALLCALWHGLTVYTDLSFAGQDEDGRPCQNPALAALYGGYGETLRNMGVQHLAKGDVLTQLLPLLRHGPGVETKAGIPVLEGATARVFITQRDVMKYDGPLQWVLPADAIVTAAARDAASRRKITLHRRGGP